MRPKRERGYAQAMRLGVLLAALLLVLPCACGAPGANDAGPNDEDASVTPPTDAGTRPPDAGHTDGGSLDAGQPDSGIDAGAGQPDAGQPDAGPRRQFIFTGGSNGQIRVFAFDPLDGGLTALGITAAGNGASFLAIDVPRGRLYATNEGTHQIAAFTLNTTDAGLQFLNRVSSGGNGPAHVAVDRTGQYVFAANYGGGTVSVIPVTDGGLAAPRQTLSSLGQAHQVVTDATNRFVYAPCKSADTLAQFGFDAGALTALSPAALSTDAGAGPRHLALHPTLPRAYLINELGNTLQTLEVSAAGTMTSLQKVTTLPSTFTGANTTAEVVVHPNGQLVFGSNRGHDSIATWRVDGVTGLVTLLGHTLTGGQTPRHFSIDPSGTWLVVGNQGSSSLTLFRVDAATGLLTAVGNPTAVPAPAFAGFVELP